MIQIILKKHLKLVFLWLFAILALIGCFYWGYAKSYVIDTRWEKIVDPAISLFGILTPIILGYFIIQKDWEESLEKRLTVHFKLKNQYVMSCYEAYLSSAADIRNWGQQIGQQMNNGSFLSFYPYMQQEGPIIKAEKNGTKYQAYTLTIYLKFDNNDNYVRIGSEDKQFDTNKYVIWFENNLHTEANKVLEIDKRTEVLDLETIKELYKKKHAAKLPAQ